MPLQTPIPVKIEDDEIMFVGYTLSESIPEKKMQTILVSI